MTAFGDHHSHGQERVGPSGVAEIDEAVAIMALGGQHPQASEPPTAYGAAVRKSEQRIVHELLASVIGAPIEIAATERLGGDFASVERVRLRTAHPSIGASVIVKHRRIGGAGWGFDLGNLRREFAGLRTLSDLGLGVSPPVLAGDDTAGVIVLADLGDGRSVADLLFGDDPQAAADGLVEMARTVGRLHAGAVDAPAAFEAHYAAFAGGESPIARPIPGLDTPVDHCRLTIDALKDAGFPAPKNADRDLGEFAVQLADVDARTMSHTDLFNPHNTLVVDGRVWLVDFEGAGYRHFGLDAGYLRFPFMNYALDLPPAVRSSMEHAYRGELVGTPWEADATYAAAMAIGCVCAAITTCHGIARAVNPEQSVESARRRRVRLVRVLDAAAAALTDAGQLPALTAWFADLAAATRGRWPEAAESVARFPAFNSSA